jgi:hypothetical protein
MGSRRAAPATENPARQQQRRSLASSAGCLLAGQTTGRRHGVRAAIGEEFVAPPQLPGLPRSPGDAPGLVGGHARPPSISAFTTRQPSDWGAVLGWRAIRMAAPKRSPVCWIVSSTLPGS